MYRSFFGRSAANTDFEGNLISTYAEISHRNVKNIPVRLTVQKGIFDK